MNIALCSPNKNAYSETFIQAHKNNLKGNIFYYYDGELPFKLEKGLLINSRKKRLLDLVKGHLNLNEFSLAQQAVITSFKNNTIDLVFAEYGGTGNRLLPICKHFNLPLIVHFHGFDASSFEELEKNNNYQEVFEYARYVVVVSKKMYKDFIKLGCPESKLVYTVCGPHPDFFDISPSFDNLQFIFAGRFVDKKAPYYLILAFLKVLEEFPAARLVLAGDGPLWSTCKNLVSYYGLEDNVELPGVITPDRLRSLLKDSVALVQHSITAPDGDAEGTPVAILEAGAAGLPVVATRHAGIPDIISHEHNGLLVEEHDVNGMAEHMIRILGEPEFAKKMGKENREIIKKNYTLKKHINMLNDLVEGLVG